MEAKKIWHSFCSNKNGAFNIYVITVMFKPRKVNDQYRENVFSSLLSMYVLCKFYILMHTLKNG
jgi:hypothetical protein